MMLGNSAGSSVVKVFTPVSVQPVNMDDNCIALFYIGVYMVALSYQLISVVV